MAALVGLDPFMSRSDVFLEKTGVLQDVDDEHESIVLKIGKIFEDAVITLFSEVRGVDVKRSVWLEHGIFCANLDGLIENDNEIVEAKTTGKVDEWGEQWTNDVPEQHIVQVHEQFYVTTMATGRDCKKAWLPVLLPGYRSLQFRTYVVERDDSLVNNLVELGQNFWNEHVATGLRPEPFEPKMELIKRVRREPASIADVPDDLIADWLQANRARLDAEKLEETAQKRLLGALGNAEAGESPSGRFVTYFEQSRAGYTVKPTSFRVLRAPKGKQPKQLKG